MPQAWFEFLFASYAVCNFANSTRNLVCHLLLISTGVECSSHITFKNTDTDTNTDTNTNTDTHTYINTNTKATTKTTIWYLLLILLTAYTTYYLILIYLLLTASCLYYLLLLPSTTATTFMSLVSDCTCSRTVFISTGKGGYTRAEEALHPKQSKKKALLPRQSKKCVPHRRQVCTFQYEG